MNLTITQPFIDRCSEVQLQICTKYDNNVLVPIIVSLIIIGIRIFVLYNIKTKNDWYYRFEFILEFSTIILLLTSILWILQIR